MPIIKLCNNLVNDAKIAGETHGRSADEQIEHWAKIAMVMEKHPGVSYQIAKQTNLL